MGDWLDGWARRAARPKDESPNASSGLSRRQLLKRAGVVAGAAWTVPVIQTALAPPAAASGGSLLPGATCSTDAQCSGTTVCIAGYCQQPGIGWAGEACNPQNNGSDCYSGVCTASTTTAGTCAAGVVGKTCHAITDCLSTASTGTVNCSSSTNTCGGTGASCSKNAGCVSNHCDKTALVCA